MRAEQAVRVCCEPPFWAPACLLQCAFREDADTVSRRALRHRLTTKRRAIAKKRHSQATVRGEYEDKEHHDE